LTTESNNTSVFSVSELTGMIQSMIEETFPFVWVEGEISNFSRPASGHYYLTLKDADAQIRAVMFRMQARYLRFQPENGMSVLVRGRVSVYAPRGEYQLVLDHIEPLGAGALALAFEQTRKKLAAQGIFDVEAKRSLPFLPQRVAVVTSPTGAAIRDFLKVLERRFANIEITIVPVRVQGDHAAEDMVLAIQLINRLLPSDVIVLTRGGGSMEDLQPFNEEELALAIRASDIPVVSAVGHEVDTTIADLAADLRAPTPSAAAEILVAEKASLTRHLEVLSGRLKTSVDTRINGTRLLLRNLSTRLKDPRSRMVDHRLRLDELQTRMVRNASLMMERNTGRLAHEKRVLWTHSPMEIIKSRRRELIHSSTALANGTRTVLERFRTNLAFAGRRMHDLSPLAVLDRGYSIARRVPDGAVIMDTSDIRPGDPLEVTVARGALSCVVREVSNERKFRG